MRNYILSLLCVFALFTIIIVVINSDDDNKPVITIEYVDQSDWRKWWRMSFFSSGRTSVEKYDKTAEFHSREIIVKEVESTEKSELKQIIGRFCKLENVVSKVVPGVPYYSISVHSELCNNKILINASATGFDLALQRDSTISANNTTEVDRKWIIKTIGELRDDRIE